MCAARHRGDRTRAWGDRVPPTSGKVRMAPRRRGENRVATLPPALAVDARDEASSTWEGIRPADPSASVIRVVPTTFTAL